MLSGGEGDVATVAPSSRLRRQHGLQLPLHPLQLSGWLVAAALAVGAFLVLVPALPTAAQPGALAALSALLLLHLAAHLGAALTDPAEAPLRRRPLEPVPQLDKTKHPHVIEGGVCHLCRIPCSGPRTKHCSACNKCVAGFDHHCKWLNHCVGSRNYASFIMCVSTAVAAATLVAALAVAELATHNKLWGDSHPHHNDKDQPLPESNSTAALPPPSSLPSSDAAFLAVVAALGLLAAVTAGLLLHLCFFHIYISFLGLTTYEYIRQQRQNQTQPAAPPVRREDEEHADKSTLRHRPVNLHCGEERSRTTLFACTILEETFSNCSSTTEATPTPPTTPQDCQLCVLTNNSVAPEVKQLPQPKKLRKKWNCCVSVPDSPDDPHSPSEPRCLMSLCRHKAKSKSLPALEGRPHRTHGHWSSAKLRMLFRILGNLGQNRRRSSQSSPAHPSPQPVHRGSNQVLPTPPPSANDADAIHTVNNLVPVSCYPDLARRANALPALPAPPRRRLISDTELANALAALQQQQRCGSGNARRPLYRRRRRSAAHRTKTPALSPIHESGLVQSGVAFAPELRSVCH
ncbi:hypothetical protein NQ315_006461 [Exocentrus adspersus]|uniref:Palmitoyltransferase n=1 Tax=Exocentrus adspersus TaxID=1586481 RepID=A0AAV8W113_9CUCU|nr:hypothetical protein NQ315_006461 [Exocentrus adspersus]